MEQSVILFIAGVVVGLGVGLAVAWFRGRDARRMEEDMKNLFSSISYEALQKNNEQFLQLANESLSKHAQTGEQALETKKGLIDQTLKSMRGDMEKVQNLMTTLEKDRHQKFGELSQQLQRTAQQTEQLQETAHQLRTALANTKARGQWGERMAEDVLRMAGFIEGVNYQKQKAVEDGNTRPDYTFLLPQGHVVNMDVKFPLDNYLLYLEAENEHEKEQYRQQFLKDARMRIKEATKRGYVDTNSNTLDYVLVFIPNEQVYAFLNEHDQELLDLAMKNKVILCSPITLFAILSVIRQAVDNFRLERTAGEILKVLGDFRKQWGMYNEVVEKVGNRIDDAQKAYHTLMTTRTNMMERQLNKIDELQEKEAERLSDKDEPLSQLSAVNDTKN